MLNLEKFPACWGQCLYYNQGQKRKRKKERNKINKKTIAHMYIESILQWDRVTRSKKTISLKLNHRGHCVVFFLLFILPLIFQI